MWNSSDPREETKMPLTKKGGSHRLLKSNYSDYFFSPEQLFAADLLQHPPAFAGAAPPLPDSAAFVSVAFVSVALAPEPHDFASVDEQQLPFLPFFLSLSLSLSLSVFSMLTDALLVANTVTEVPKEKVLNRSRAMIFFMV